MGRFSVRTFVRPSVRSPLWTIQPGLRPSQPGLRPSQPSLKPETWLAGWLGLRPDWLGLRPGWMTQRGGMDGRTDGRMDEHAENLHILQDFVPYQGRYPRTTTK